MGTAQITEGQPGADHPVHEETMTEEVAKALGVPVEQVIPDINQSPKVEGLDMVVGQVQSQEGLVGDLKMSFVPTSLSPNTVRSAEADKFYSKQQERKAKEEALVIEESKKAA